MGMIQLMQDEQFIAEAMASHVKKMLFLPQPNPGKLNVTNKRVIFNGSKVSAQFEYKVEDISSFSVGAGKSITLNISDGNQLKLTGMYNGKLIDALKQAGIKQD